jgi:hypothetical protein
MAVAAFLNNADLTVEAGGEAVCEVRIRNTGDVVDQFTVEVFGDTKTWCTVEPAVVNLLPGAEVAVRAVFAPPRSSEVRAGAVPFAIRVQSREDPHGSTVEEGEIDVAPFTDVVAELVPAKRRGRRRAKYKLAVDNNGNQPVSVDAMAIDPEDELRLRVQPATMRIEPGNAVIAKLKVVPHKRFLKGEPKSHPFQVVVLPAGGKEIVSDGVMTQEQLLPKWLIPAVALLVAAVAALVALWFLLLRPQVQSMATDAAQQQASQVASAAQQAGQAAKQASQAAQAAQGGSGGGAANGSGGSAGGAKGTGTTGQPGQGGGAAGAQGGAGANPVSFRIAAAANPVTDGSYQRFSYTVPQHQAVDISDLVLQNPRGDTGYLRLMVGNNVVLEEGLANFRDLDYHYVVPLHADPDQPVVIAVNCQAPGGGANQCTPSVSFSGRVSP